MKSFMLRLGYVRLLLAALLAGLALSGCDHNPYRVDNDYPHGSDYKAKGKTIAVISGLPEEGNVDIAKLVADSLRKNSRFQVLSNTQIAQHVNYPQRIKGPYKSAYMSILTDWDLSDRKKISEIQRALGVDYVYVIWAPIMMQWNNSKAVNIDAVAQLFEQPEANPVLQSSIGLIADEKKPYLKQGVDEVARQLAEKTHMQIQQN